MYRVKLQEFEGPLDLLLFFIKRDELDIQDIPIARITREFLDYLHYMQELDLEVAGDFIVMAAELMQIKVRMLLPRPAAEGEEEQDPRADLVRRLLEYRRYKEASALLSSLEDESGKLHYRRAFQMDPREVSPADQEEVLKNVTMFNLISAFKRVLESAPRKAYHDVELLNVSIDEQMGYIADVFRLRPSVSFFELVAHMQEKIRIVVTIIAMLEMVKNRVIGLREADHEDDFIVYRIVPGAA